MADGHWFALGPAPELTAVRARVPERGDPSVAVGPATEADLRDVRPRGFRLLLRPDGRAEVHRRGSPLVLHGSWEEHPPIVRFSLAAGPNHTCDGRLTRTERGFRLDALYTAARTGGVWPAVVRIRSGLLASGPSYEEAEQGTFTGTLCPETGTAHAASVSLGERSVHVFSTDVQTPGGLLWFGSEPDAGTIDREPGRVTLRYGPEHQRAGAPIWYPPGPVLIPVQGERGLARLRISGGRLSGTIEASGVDPFTGAPLAYRATIDAVAEKPEPPPPREPPRLPEGRWRTLHGPSLDWDRPAEPWTARHVPSLDFVIGLADDDLVVLARAGPPPGPSGDDRLELRMAAQALVVESRFAEARPALRRALERYGDDPRGSLHILEHLLVCAAALADHPALLDALRAATRLRAGLAGEASTSPALVRGALHAMLDQVQRLERWRAGLAGDQDRIEQMELAAPFYRDLVRGLLDLGEHRLALLAAEAGRARAFADLLGSADRRPATLPPLNEERLSRLLAGLDRTVVVYFLDGDTLVRWVAARDGTLTAEAGRIDPAALEHAVETVHQAGRSRVPPPPASVEAALESLGETLWPGDLPGDPDSPVLVVPHGPLLRVPFAALRVGAEPLVRRHALTVLPALALAEPLLARRERRPARRPALLAFVSPERMPDGLGPRPWTAEAFPAIADQYGPGHAVVRVGAAADAASLLADAPKASVLYFATHAVVDPADPMGSYVALNRSPAHDGRFTARDVLGLDLAAELVILATCDSGSGAVSSDGVIGLSRSFLAQGPTALLLTLTLMGEVDSLDLMYEFHLGWLGSGLPPPAALRRAQAEMAERLPHAPHRWAPFVLFGI